MLAMDFIKANRETVERAIRDKGVNLDLDQLLGLDGEARSLKTEIDNLRAERNAISARFKDAAPEEKASLGAQAKAAGARASELEVELGDHCNIVEQRNQTGRHEIPLKMAVAR